MEEKYFEILIKLAKKAAKKGEVPVSSLIVNDGKIIAKAYNKREKGKNVFNHAEMLVIKKASRKLKDWRLSTCNLYVTLKPCSMCQSIINQSRIKNVYYLLDKPKEKLEFYKTKYNKANNSTFEETYSKELRDFFQKKRDKKK